MSRLSVAECDCCAKVSEYDPTESESELNMWLKGDGWMVTPVRKSWADYYEDYCPVCVEAGRHEEKVETNS